MRTLGLVRAAASTTLGGGENQALAQIYAASGSPRLWRVLPDVDRVEAQGIVGGLSVAAVARRNPIVKRSIGLHVARFIYRSEGRRGSVPRQSKPAPPSVNK